MSVFKLLVHQKTFSEDDVILNQKDYPGCNIGDVIEVYAPEDEYSRLLLQIKSFPDEKDYQSKDKPSISIEHSIANTFQLKSYTDVIVNKVDPNIVLLDSIEVIFKDQYFSRSDMWRIRKELNNQIVFLNKKFEFLSLRFQVFEMWSQGEIVASGYINHNTKIVYRSASSMVYLFIQMSSEMWDFDINGDLYFEKAVNGFLSDLFDKWRRFNCNHDVTIVLFSRTYYEANSINDFPEEMRECLQQDHRNRFYEDFYRVAIQNERYEEWNSTITLLKKLFTNYEKHVLYHYKRFTKKNFKTYNSIASQGNFLEVLNMSLNVFEKHYLDRSFDRTGQLSVVISPGVGVYEVDYDLANITKQRIIDNGIGNDLVCLGEQPLHAVPLFKFNKKKQENLNNSSEMYNMPHWINLSYYSSKKQSRFSIFTPRIKMPNVELEIDNEEILTFNDINLDKKTKIENYLPSITKTEFFKNKTNECDSISISSTDYDEYDENIFKNKNNINNNEKIVSRRRKSALSSPLSNISSNIKENNIYNKIEKSFTKRIDILKSSDEIDATDKDESLNLNNLSQKHSLLINSFNDSRQTYSCKIDESNYSYKFQNKSKIPINPFDINHVPFRLTSNRRRWTHVFPVGPSGIFMQQHHFWALPQNIACSLMPINSNETSFRKISSSTHLNSLNSENASLGNTINYLQNYDDIDSSIDFNKSDQLVLNNFNNENEKKNSFSEIFKFNNYFNVALMNNCSNDMFEWTPLITTGIDWKSLIIPASLPITTDFLPDIKSLENDYLDSEYSLIPEDQSADLFQRRCYKDENHHNHFPLKNEEVFQELVCQRLQQGYQLVVNCNQMNIFQNNYNFKKENLQNKDRKNNNSIINNKFYILSIGRIFHQLELENFTIKIKISRPRKSNENIKIKYCYRFRSLNNDNYGESWVDFMTEKLENYNWNYLDNYLCLKGDEQEYKLRETFKFWRLKMLLLPSMQLQTKQIIENIINKKAFYCDIYKKITPQEKDRLNQGFLKFFNIINRIKKTSSQPPAKNILNKDLLNPKNDHNVRRHSSGYQSSNNSRINSFVSENSFRERISSCILEKPLKQLNVFFNDRSRDDDIYPLIIETESLKNSFENLENVFIQNTPKKIPQNNLSNIIEAMKNGTNECNFIPKQSNLPEYVFISAEAVYWAIQNVEEITNENLAIVLFQRLLDHKLICHASGSFVYPFKYGFFLYYIVVKTTKLIDDRVDLEMFKREWFEVELSLNNSISTINNQKTNIQEIPAVKYSRLKNPINSIKAVSFSSNTKTFSEPNANNKQTMKGTNYYKSVLDIDFSSKHKRAEWLHIKYQQVYNIFQAFEIVLEWMVATGNQIADIVQGWARKSGQTGLHLVPIPSDPFALPFSSKSDPLRAPIYVSLNLSCLPSEFVDDLLNSKKTLLKFREEILSKFGFLPFLGGKEDQKQYVHVSGSIFVLIPNSTNKEKIKKDNLKNNKVELDDSSPHEIYLTKHFYENKQNKKFSEDMRTGFLWSWNYMISKRWKSNTTGDETFQRNVLKDFKLFCSNDEKRLKNFFNEKQSLFEQNDLVIKSLN